MEQLGRPDHVGAEGITDALVPEAHAEYRAAAAEALDQRHADAGVLRPAGPGRDHYPHRRQVLDVVEGQCIVAADYGVSAELAQVLDEVIDERVVVVDYQHGRAH